MSAAPGLKRVHTVSETSHAALEEMLRSPPAANPRYAAKWLVKALEMSCCPGRRVGCLTCAGSEAEPTNAQTQGSSSGGPKSVMLNGGQNAGSCGAIALAFVISMKNGSKRLAGTATNVTRPGPSPT